MRINPSIWLTPVLLFACLAARASTPQEASEETTKTEEIRPLRIVINEDLPTFDPHQHLSATGSAVLCNIFEPLVCRDLEDQPKPCLAERWESVDSKTWSFFLRPNVSFQNGKKVTVDDALFSLERARTEEKSEVAGFLAAVVSISGDEASRLVKIVLSEPNVFFLESLSQIMIVPEGSPNPIVQPTGTGPYRLDAYERGTIVRLKAFQDYWQGTPKEPRAEFLIIPSADKATDLLLSGEVDLVRQLPPRLVGRVEAKDELWVESRLSQTVVYLQLNPGIAPFDDPLLRQAIDLAVDREALVHKVTLNHSRPASQMLTPSLFGFNPSLKPTVRDLDRARKLLAQTQLKKPVSITIQTTDAYLRTGRAIEAQLEEAGFNVELVDRPWPELYSDLMQGTVAAWLGFWGFDSSDASVFFNMVVHSRSEDGYLGSVNLTSVENDPLDATIRAAAVEPDLEKRRTKLEEIARLATEQKIRIPLLWPLDLYGTRRDFDWQARKDRALLVTEMNRGR